jgi:hypothetical protein
MLSLVIHRLLWLWNIHQLWTEHISEPKVGSYATYILTELNRSDMSHQYITSPRMCTNINHIPRDACNIFYKFRLMHCFKLVTPDLLLIRQNIIQGIILNTESKENCKHLELGSQSKLITLIHRIRVTLENASCLAALNLGYFVLLCCDNLKRLCCEI